jgi:hypothetical protein
MRRLGVLGVDVTGSRFVLELECTVLDDCMSLYIIYLNISEDAT